MTGDTANGAYQGSTDGWSSKRKALRIHWWVTQKTKHTKNEDPLTDEAANGRHQGSTNGWRSKRSTEGWGSTDGWSSKRKTPRIRTQQQDTKDTDPLVDDAAMTSESHSSHDLWNWYKYIYSVPYYLASVNIHFIHGHVLIPKYHTQNTPCDFCIFI